MKKTISFFLVMVLVWACTKEPFETRPPGKSSSRAMSNQENALLTTVSFSGYSWYIKQTGNRKAGPGPNYWSSRNVWVDSSGFLHLVIRKVKGRWACAEVESVETFGAGTYQWQVEGRIDRLDKNVVLGLFDYSGNDGYDEMDMEFARWGNGANPNLNYTVWPAATGVDKFSYSQEFALNGTYTTQRMTRGTDSVVFKSLHGFTDADIHLFATAICTAPPYSVSVLKMPVHMNLWLFLGNGPTDGKPVEIVIHAFKYTPA